MELPLQYIKNMRELLGDAYAEYEASFEEPRYYGLRVNTMKIGQADLVEKNEFTLSAVPWCAEGFYYQEGERPAKHPYYHAGLYYLQEPSAMSPAAILPIDEGDYVLDVCAAPGGKSTQLAARLNGTGILVANDISAGRAKTLLKNMERFGITNGIVMSESPQRLEERFENYFDKILIDAPCSGEGMFRKEPDMVKSWDEAMLEFCQMEQEKILQSCGKMLKQGGMLLYSTCTFSPEENEKSIATFLQNNPDFCVVPIAKAHGFAEGVGELSACARLYPHKIKGEGHFLALLQKTGGDTAPCHLPTEEGASQKELEPFLVFQKEVLTQKLSGVLKVFGEYLYVLPTDMPSVKGLRALRTGWQLGTLKKGRFEPSQPFAMGLRKEDVQNVTDFALDDTRVIRYLKGETIDAEGDDGWTLVCVDTYPLGWAKRQKGRLKNKYAVSWKWE